MPIRVRSGRVTVGYAREGDALRSRSQGMEEKVIIGCVRVETVWER